MPSTQAAFNEHGLHPIRKHPKAHFQCLISNVIPEQLLQNMGDSDYFIADAEFYTFIAKNLQASSTTCWELVTAISYIIRVQEKLLVHNEVGCDCQHQASVASVTLEDHEIFSGGEFACFL